MVYKVQNKSDFDGQLTAAGSKLVVVDFFAPWCGPCKVIAPRLDELAAQYGDKVVVIKVDVDECEDIAMEYNISSMPTFVFIKNGAKLYSFSGANGDNLAKHFAEYA
ncbi:thioredoxin-2 [Episyrphus balteatus]|uniref:thioredoxin-2 n=1 Tax=Episyrphus balteatus TaxID=286459 RepID=UPI002485108B|nr:thioredoxin-2 [Episyrphus balteatus]